MTTLLNLIAGEFVEPVSGTWSERGRTPDGRSPLEPLPDGSDRDVALALSAAGQAREAWSTLSPFARADVLRALAASLRSRSGQLSDTMCREIGKPIGEARAEVENAARVVEFYAGLAHALGGSHLPSAREGVHLFTMREPRGVAGVITPWNFPVNLPIVKMAPALLSGNVVVWKPASPAAESSVALAECLIDAGLPPGVVAMVLGGGQAVGDPLIDSNLGAISFTGSCEVGHDIERRSVARGVRTLTELGGKNVSIVCADADLNLAAETVVGGAFRYAGQKCTATSRVVVDESVHDELVALITERVASLRVGLPEDPETYLGPVISGEAADHALAVVAGAAAEGARVVAGGSRAVVAGAPDGAFVQPTVVDNVSTGMRIAREELFAPVLAIISSEGTEAAFAAAADTEFGLTASIFTRDLGTAFAYVAAADVGAVNVNLPTAGLEFQVPIGGRRDSGSGGLEQGVEALDFYTRSKSVAIRHSP